MREEEFKIPLCNPSDGNVLLRQSCNQNFVKHQQHSSSAKTANSLNMLTVPTKRLHLQLDCKCRSDWRCCECGV